MDDPAEMGRRKGSFVIRSVLKALTLVAFLLLSTDLFAAIEISGTIIAKKGNLVQVEFQADGETVPQLGDQVNFVTYLEQLPGVPVAAGQGRVTEIIGETVWVKTVDDRPQLKMSAKIQATGTMTRALPQPLPNSGSSGVANPSDIRTEIIKELIRLNYISAGTKDVPSDILQTAVDLCGILEGFATGHPINAELLQRLKSIDSK
jgi:hypothetical protein